MTSENIIYSPSKGPMIPLRTAVQGWITETAYLRHRIRPVAAFMILLVGYL